MRSLIAGRGTSAIASLALSVSLAGLWLLVPAHGSPPIHTRPAIPQSDRLAQFGLTKRWHTILPLAGKRDALSTVQALGTQLIVQSASGNLFALDAETGAAHWQIRLGQAFRSHQEAVAANGKTLIVAIDTKLYGIDRASGLTDWRIELPGVLAAAPVADSERLFLCTNRGGMHGYVLPLPSEGRAVVDAYAPTAEPAATGLGGIDIRSQITTPQQLWAFNSDTPLRQPPVITSSHVIVSNARGEVLSFTRDSRELADQFATRGRVTAPSAQAGDNVYIPSEDHHVYAFEMEDFILSGGKMNMRWRFTGGSKIVRKPAVVGDELYVASFGVGLFCLDRGTGKPKWSFADADRFLAASKRLVFAGDHNGRVLILDRQRGKHIATWDVSDFAHRVTNERNDRLYLANHDGLVVCIHDLQTKETPLRHDRAAEPKPEQAAAQ